LTKFTLEELALIIESRASADAEKSYTKSLLDGGVSRTSRKFGEEAIEIVIAALQGDRSAVVTEAADVFFHLLVLMKAANVTLPEVLEELERRTVRSGIEEKKARHG
jgi:phosphoribosyl-ATP pyrophosphohydrolase